MEKIQYNNDLFKEALTVLAYLDNNIIEKIPTHVFEKLKELAADSKKDFYIDTEKGLAEQNISEECKDLISLIYYDFAADEDEKKEILKSWNENEKKYSEKYDLNKIFQNETKGTQTIEPSTTVPNTSVSEYKKETLFDKIKNFFKNIFTKKD